MKIPHLDLPSGTTQGIPFLIDAHWTPEQAMAVFELINDLGDQIWAHYGQQLQSLYRDDRRPRDNNGAPSTNPDDEAF
jgi:hypothetical protein